MATAPITPEIHTPTVETRTTPAVVPENVKKENPLVGTEQSINAEAEAFQINLLDHQTKTSILRYFNQFGQVVGRMQEKGSPAIEQDSLYLKAQSVWQEHRDFFQQVENDEQEDADHPDNSNEHLYDLSQFTDGEVIVMRGAFIKMADQLTHSIGLRRNRPNTRIETTGSRVVRPGGLFRKEITEEIDLIDTGAMTLNSLKTQHFIEDSGPAGATTGEKHVGALAEEMRFFDTEFYSPRDQTRIIVGLQNAEIALREHLSGIKSTDSAFNRDGLTIEMAHRREEILVTMYPGRGEFSLTAKERAAFRERVITESVDFLSKDVALRVLENRRDTEFTREDLLKRAQDRAVEIRGKLGQRPVYEIEYSDGRKVEVGIAAFTTAKGKRETAERAVETTKSAADAIDADIARLEDLKSREVTITSDRNAAQAVLNGMAPLSNNTEIKARRSALETERFEVYDKDGKPVIGGGGAIRTRTRNPKEVEADLGSEITRFNDAKKKLRTANSELSELAALNARTLTTEKQTADKAYEDALTIQNKTPKTIESSDISRNEALEQIELIIGNEEQKTTYKEKLIHVGDVMSNPSLKKRALESYESLRRTILHTENSSDGQKLGNEKVLTDEVLVQGLIDGLGVTRTDLVTWGFTPGMIDAQRPIVLWNAIYGNGGNAVQVRAYHRLFGLLQNKLMGQMRASTAGDNIRIGISLVNERLQAAASGNISRYTGIESRGDVWMKHRI